MNATNGPAQLKRERQHLLRRVSRALDWPMTLLSFVWLGLMIVEFTWELAPVLEALSYGIWIAFVLHFGLEFWIAPDKWKYLRNNWLTALALVLPALRGLRLFRMAAFWRAARVGRGLRLVRWITSLNRGMKATQKAAHQRGLRYVFALTLLVVFAGAAGIYRFENPRALAEESQAAGSTEPALDSGIHSYGEALWWTAMMVTTMGSDYFPKSTEGRIIALLLATYAFAIFGYITATVATMIVRVDQPAANETEVAAELSLLRREIAEMRMLLVKAQS
jgi:voltage-gated potassium channel